MELTRVFTLLKPPQPCYPGFETAPGRSKLLKAVQPC